MLDRNIVTIDYTSVNNAIQSVFPPVIIAMNSDTLLTFMRGAEDNPEAKITIQEDGFEEIITYNEIPISINPLMPFGQVIVK